MRAVPTAEVRAASREKGGEFTGIDQTLQLSIDSFHLRRKVDFNSWRRRRPVRPSPVAESTGVALAFEPLDQCMRESCSAGSGPWEDCASQRAKVPEMSKA